MVNLNYFRRLNKEEKEFVKNYIYDILMHFYTYLPLFVPHL